MMQALSEALFFLGGAFCLLGAIGLVRLPDFYTRLHGPAKTVSLGLGAILLALAIESSWRFLLLAVFIALTTPLSAQVLARTARRLDLPFAPQTQVSKKQAPALDEEKAKEVAAKPKDT